MVYAERRVVARGRGGAVEARVAVLAAASGLPSEVRKRCRLGGDEGQARDHEEQDGHYGGEQVHVLINESSGEPVATERKA